MPQRGNMIFRSLREGALCDQHAEQCEEIVKNTLTFIIYGTIIRVWMFFTKNKNIANLF